MTNEEIIEAQKLIADMRNVLTVLAGTTGANELAALVREKWPQWMGSLTQLVRLGIVPDGKSVMPLRLDEIWGLLDLINRRPELKSKLAVAVAEQVRRVGPLLDNISQALAETKTATEP